MIPNSFYHCSGSRSGDGKGYCRLRCKDSSEYIGDIMEMVPPKVIEEGTVSDKKASPSNGKNAMIGAMLGMFWYVV